MTERAISLIEKKDYPDIYKFRNEIYRGSASAVADQFITHKKGYTGDTFAYTYDHHAKLSKSKWDNSVIKLHNAGRYADEGSYFWIGQLAHLTQDASAPPHSLQAHIGFTRAIDPFETAGSSYYQYSIRI
jgi:hypothetical protein